MRSFILHVLPCRKVTFRGGADVTTRERKRSHGNMNLLAAKVKCTKECETITSDAAFIFLNIQK